MRTLYLDCFSGIAGDMTLAALVDLGADLSYIIDHLKQLPIDAFEMDVQSVVKQGVAAKTLHLHIDEGHDHHHSHSHDHSHAHGDHHHDHDQHYHFHVVHDHHHHDHDHGHDHAHDHHHEHRRAADILSMIESSQLPDRVKQRSMAIFQVIAEAEGKIHGIDPSEVHFHEVGAMDSIIDTIGVCLALENLEIDEIYASPVATGQGYAKMAHGLYPIPAPATFELLKGIPLAELNARGELTTPTGAGILKALVKEFKPIIPSMTVDRIGYGAGTKDFDHPNVLRALLLEENGAMIRESIYVLEAQLDDMSGEALGYTMEQLFKAGALDVYYSPVFMKKNRPGTLITVLAALDKADHCEDVILTETTTLGVRRSLWTRNILERRFITVETSYGEITVKQAMRDNQIVHEAPEYEDVARAAQLHGVPFYQVYQAVLSEMKK